MATETPKPTPTPAPPATPLPPAAPESPPAPADPPAPDADDEGSIDWKAQSRKWEGLAKKNHDAAKRLEEIEAAQLSEAEKSAKRIRELEAENESFKLKEQLKQWATEVAEATKVPATLLRGSTKEELEAHAAELATALQAAQPPADPPAPVLTVGQTPPPPGNLSLPEQIAAAEAAGNTQLVAALKAVQLSG